MAYLIREVKYYPCDTTRDRCLTRSLLNMTFDKKKSILQLRHAGEQPTLISVKKPAPISVTTTTISTVAVSK